MMKSQWKKLRLIVILIENLKKKPINYVLAGNQVREAFHYLAKCGQS